MKIMQCVSLIAPYYERGGTVGMTDSNQALVNAYSYTPYGRIVNREETVSQPFTYVGGNPVSFADPSGQCPTC